MAKQSDYAKTKGVSEASLYLNPNNHLGLDYNKSRSDLLALALSHPVGYYNLRSEVITAITEEAVLAIYDKIWSILSTGLVPKSGDKNEHQIQYQPKTGPKVNFSPNLPSVQISKYAMSLAQQVQVTSEAIVEILLPQDYLKLSQSTTRALTKAEGVSI